MSLWADFLTNDKRSINKWTHYFPAYERHLSRFRNLSITVLEIGMGEGGSAQMWKRYFGPLAQIVAIDTRKSRRRLEEDQISVRIGNQADVGFLSDVVTEFGPFDIVLDDGSHRSDQMATSFRFLYPKVNRNGVYLIEDLHCCYWESHGGGYKNPHSFLEVCKDLIDQLNADHTQGAVAPNEFSASTMSIHFYDSIVVFEKGRHLGKTALSIPVSSPRPPRGWKLPLVGK